MEKLGRLFDVARPEAVVIATPHNVHVAGAIGVVVAGRVAGRLSGAPPSVALDLPSDTELAWLLLDQLRSTETPSVGISFGGNDPISAVAPMDWGVLIPLWFMGGRSEPPVPAVVVTPARDLSAEQHVDAGRAIARAAVASGRRVAFIASADHGHAHVTDGPYGFDPMADEYDALVQGLVKTNSLEGLLNIAPGMVESAKADSWWQMLMLHGATEKGWTGKLISYEAPTYFGMLTAAYSPNDRRQKPVDPVPSRGTSSPPGTRTRRQTPAR